MVFDAISSNIDEALSINPSLVFFFEGFNVHHKDWLTYSGETDRPGELSYILIPWLTLLRWLTFLLGSLTVTFAILFYGIYLFLLMVVFALQWLSLNWILIVLLSQFPLTFRQTQMEMPFLIAQLMTIFMLIETIFLIISEMFHGRISLNLVLLLLLVNFVSGFRWRLTYISLFVNIKSSQIHLHGFHLLVQLP